MTCVLQYESTFKNISQLFSIQNTIREYHVFHSWYILLNDLMLRSFCRNCFCCMTAIVDPIPWVLVIVFICTISLILSTQFLDVLFLSAAVHVYTVVSSRVHRKWRISTFFLLFFCFPLFLSFVPVLVFIFCFPGYILLFLSESKYWCCFAYFYHLRVNISVCYSQSLTFIILASLQAYGLVELSLKWWSSGIWTYWNAVFDMK